MLRRLRETLRSPERGRGVANVNMALVVAFALAAIIELTRTWFGAMHISDDLAVVDNQARAIRQDTEQIQRLYRTSQLTGDIRQQTDPLERQVATINQTAAQINTRSQQIQATAGEITQRVHEVTGTARNINTTAAQLVGTVRSIEGNATEIHGDVQGIQRDFAALLPVTQEINAGVTTTNREVDAVIALSQGIRGDLADILASVNAVQGHTASICSALLVNGPGC